MVQMIFCFEKNQIILKNWILLRCFSSIYDKSDSIGGH